MAASLQLDPFVSDPRLLQQAEQRRQHQLSMDPDSGPTLRALAEVYRKQGNLEQAAVLYERLVRLDPQDRDAGDLHALLRGRARPSAPDGVSSHSLCLVEGFSATGFPRGPSALRDLSSKSVCLVAGSADTPNTSRTFGKLWSSRVRGSTCSNSSHTWEMLLPEALPAFTSRPLLH